jgi:hypothetical protein
LARSTSYEAPPRAVFSNLLSLHLSSVLPHIKAIKSRKVRWAAYALHMRETRNAYIILIGKLEEKRMSHWET